MPRFIIRRRGILSAGCRWIRGRPARQKGLPRERALGNRISFLLRGTGGLALKFQLVSIRSSGWIQSAGLLAARFGFVTRVEFVVPPMPTVAPPNIVVLSGAGLSAESGVPTFRGADGLWEGQMDRRGGDPRRVPTISDTATASTIFGERH